MIVALVVIGLAVLALAFQSRIRTRPVPVPAQDEDDPWGIEAYRRRIGAELDRQRSLGLRD